MWPKQITWPFDSRWVTSYRWSIVTMRLSAPLRRYSASKIMGSRLWPFGVTWRHRPRDHSTRHMWFPIGGPSMRLTCIIREIWTLKLAFAMVKGQKFTAYAPCHVTCRQGVQNNRIFEIPESTLSIHYATLVGLRWRLRVVCRWASPLLSIFSCNFSVRKWSKNLQFWGD